MSSSTSVVFENATISEAVKRLGRVAPTRGEAYDKASGIVLEITPGAEWPVVMKATNLSIYYLEWVSAIESAGDKLSWRVATETFTQIITRLPIGSGKTVEFTEVDGKLQIKSGRFKASIGLIKVGHYPEWGPFDPSQTAPVSELGSRIDQVSWAAAKRETGDAINGIRFDGDTLAATDRYRLVSVPCVAPHLSESVVIPPGVISSLINGAGETKVGILGNQLIMSPNDYTQIRCVTLASDYPNISRVMFRDHPESIKIDKNLFMDSINRVSAADHKNRMPQLSLYLGDEAIALYMEEESGTDRTIDIIELPGQAVHDRFQIFISPQSLLECLTAAPADIVTLKYDKSNNMKIIQVTADSGYESWIVPRTGVRAAPEESE